MKIRIQTLGDQKEIFDRLLMLTMKPSRIESSAYTHALAVGINRRFAIDTIRLGGNLFAANLDW